MEYINNGIKFNNVKSEQGLRLSSNPIIIAGLTGTDPDDGAGIINAVDIDWNGAELESLITNNNIKSKLSNLTINTTSDLLKLIIELINNINVSNNKYWFSYGITEITANNYTTANEAIQVSSYPSEVEFTPSSRQYIYILVKNDISVEIVDATTNAVAFITEDSILIPEYKIIKTNGKVGGKVYIRINSNDESQNEEEIIDDYYFSYGSEEITLDNYTTANNAEKIINDEYNSEYEYTMESRNYIYILINENKNVELYETTFNTQLYISELDNIKIKGHKIIKSNGKIFGNVRIKIS